MRHEDDRPNDPAAEPEWWLWRPNRRRGNYGLLLMQALLPVWFFIALSENAFAQQISVHSTLFALWMAGCLLYISGFGIGSETDHRNLMFSKIWQPLTLCIVMPIAATASSSAPSLVSVFILFIAQLIAAWVCDKAAEQLDKATQPALSSSSTNK